MVSGFVFILTVVLLVTLIMFTVGERESLGILFICVGTAVRAVLFLQCELNPLQMQCGIN